MGAGCVKRASTPCSRPPAGSSALSGLVCSPIATQGSSAPRTAFSLGYRSAAPFGAIASEGKFCLRILCDAQYDVSMRVERELMRGAGPVAVLRLLEGGERYGYELVQLLEERTDGVLAMG